MGPNDQTGLPASRPARGARLAPEPAARLFRCRPAAAYSRGRRARPRARGAGRARSARGARAAGRAPAGGRRLPAGSAHERRRQPAHAQLSGLLARGAPLGDGDRRRARPLGYPPAARYSGRGGRRQRQRAARRGGRPCLGGRRGHRCRCRHRRRRGRRRRCAYGRMGPARARARATELAPGGRDPAGGDRGRRGRGHSGAGGRLLGIGLSLQKRGGARAGGGALRRDDDPGQGRAAHRAAVAQPGEQRGRRRAGALGRKPVRLLHGRRTPAALQGQGLLLCRVAVQLPLQRAGGQQEP